MESWSFPPAYDSDTLPDADSRYWFPVRETMDPVEREAAIVERIGQVMRYAYDRAPFYRKKWDDAGIDPDAIKSLEDFEMMVVQAAVQEDVDVLGVSLLSGAHMTIIPEILKLLDELGASDINVVAGGVIPDDDVKELKSLGVADVLLQDSAPDEIVATLKSVVAERRPR